MTVTRGWVIVHSELCFEHASVLPTFDVPAGNGAKLRPKNPDAVFRDEVIRQRRKREGYFA